MKFKMHHKSVQRFLTVLMSFALIVSLTAGYTAKAATGTIDDKQLLNSEVIKDAALLAQLKALTKEAMEAEDISVDENAITVQNLAQYVKGDVIVNANVKDISGIGYARSAASIDLTACDVTEIHANEFERCSVTKIVLPATVNKIGAEAFKDCSKLVTVSLKDKENQGLSNITYYGDNAFEGCSSLGDATVGSMKEQVQYLGANVFSGCESITTAKVPAITSDEGKQTVPANLFNGCSLLQKVKLCDASLTRVGDGAFGYTGNVKFAVNSDEYGDQLPSSVSYIGKNAFIGSKIEALDLSQTAVTEISENTFREAQLDSKILLPARLKKIGTGAFFHSMAKEVIMPVTVTNVEEDAFRYTTRLEKISLSPNIETISNNTFLGAGSGSFFSDSASYYDPKSKNRLDVVYTDASAKDSKLSSIGNSAFSGAAIYDDQFLSGLTHLTSIGDKAFSYTDFEVVELPACVETLGTEAFNACASLKEFDFAEGSKITAIPEGCFSSNKAPKSMKDPDGGNVSTIYSCIFLEKIRLPEHLVSIGNHAFAHCYNLQTSYAAGTSEKVDTLQFPSSLTRIGTEAFSKASLYTYNGNNKLTDSLILPNCGIKAVVIPDSVTEVGTSAFAECPTMTSMTIGKGLKEIPEKMCYRCGAYPAEVNEDGVITGQTSESKHYDQETDTYDPIEFVGLKQLKLSNTVEKIGNYAFGECYALQSPSTPWNLPSNLTSIGNYAFYKCKSLDNVTFDSKLTSIGNYAFGESAQSIDLKQVVGSKTYTYQKEFTGLSEIDFQYATNLTSIGTYAFAKTKIDKASIPEGVKILSNNMFEGCYWLKTASMTAKDATKIGSDVFKNCYSLTAVSLPFSAEWATTLFSDLAGYDRKSITLNSPSASDAKVIIGQSTTLPINCFKNFGNNVKLTVSDASQGEDAPNLIENDGNNFIKAENASNLITLKGKSKGKTQIRVSGAVSLKDQNTNAAGITLSAAQLVNIDVTEEPVSSLILTNTAMVKEGGENTIYVNVENKSGIKLVGTFLPLNTTETIRWTSSDEGVVTCSDPVVDAKKGTSTVTIMPASTLAVGDSVVQAATDTWNSKETQVNVKVRMPGQKVTLNKTSATIKIGDTFDLVATISYDSKYNGLYQKYGDTVKFTSNKPEVATVDYDTGRVHVVSEGSATITAKCLVSGKTASFSIKSMQEAKVTSMEFDSTKLEYVNGGYLLKMNPASTSTVTLSVKYEPKITTDSFTCYTDDTSVAQVVSETPTPNNGKLSVSVKAIKSGDTTLHVKAGDKEITCAIQIRATATAVNISSSEMELQVGKSATLSASVVPADAIQQITWSSSNEKAVVVDNGNVKAIAVGKATITAKSDNGRMASCVITVKSSAKGLKIKAPTGNTSKVYVAKGNTISLGKYFTNDDCTDTFKFSAKKSKVATVSTTGVVTAKKPGKIKVTLTAYNGAKKTASAKITVYVTKKNAKVKKITIKGKKTVKAGKKLLLTANLKSAKAMGNVTWTCNKPAVAKVDAYGVVTALKKGKVKIKVTASNGKKKTITVKVK